MKLVNICWFAKVTLGVHLHTESEQNVWIDNSVYQEYFQDMGEEIDSLV